MFPGFVGMAGMHSFKLSISFIRLRSSSSSVEFIYRFFSVLSLSLARWRAYDVRLCLLLNMHTAKFSMSTKGITSFHSLSFNIICIISLDMYSWYGVESRTRRSLATTLHIHTVQHRQRHLLLSTWKLPSVVLQCTSCQDYLTTSSPSRSIHPTRCINAVYLLRAFYSMKSVLSLSRLSILVFSIRRFYLSCIIMLKRYSAMRPFFSALLLSSSSTFLRHSLYAHEFCTSCCAARTTT